MMPRTVITPSYYEHARGRVNHTHACPLLFFFGRPTLSLSIIILSFHFHYIVKPNRGRCVFLTRSCILFVSPFHRRGSALSWSHVLGCDSPSSEDLYMKLLRVSSDLKVCRDNARKSGSTRSQGGRQARIQPQLLADLRLTQSIRPEKLWPTATMNAIGESIRPLGAGNIPLHGVPAV